MEYAEIAVELEARERLAALTDAAVAGRTEIKRHAHRRHLRDLERAARGRRPPARAADSTTPEDSRAELAAVGVGLKIVKKDGSGE